MTKVLTPATNLDVLTMDEVADSLGTSKQRVAQIETDLKNALKNHMKNKLS